MAIGTILPMIGASQARYLSVIRDLLRLGANSAATARHFTPTSSQRHVFNALLSEGLVAEASQGQFYVDEVKLAALYKKQMRLIRCIAAAGLAAAILALFILRWS